MERMKNTMVEADKKGPVHECDHVGSFSSSSSESGISSGSSMESDSFEEVTSPASSSSAADTLSDMSSLFQQLPIKRGLSKYYQGKSQSFTSLANVSSLEDLVKPENPYNKKLKSCSSYGGALGETHRAKCTTNTISRHICKRVLHSGGSRGSCSSLNAKRGSANFMGGRPPIPPPHGHGSTSTSVSTILNPTALFV